jgi:hypothetical protein
MSALLPPSTNHQYRGAIVSAWFTVLLGIGWLGPGLIHSFLPDGGAGTIAGLDLSKSGPTIIKLFAWAGATQIIQGITLIAVGLRYRSLVPLMLLLSLLERSLLSISAWASPSPNGHHPPGAYGTLIAVPLIVLFLWLALRPRR